MKDNRSRLLELAKKIREKHPESYSNGGINALILQSYKAQTGRKVFKTFAQWKKEGFSIIKGSQGFPIFSRPIGKIKESKGIEATTEEMKYFGTAILFNELQVKK